jgi:hypothetical protein
MRLSITLLALLAIFWTAGCASPPAPISGATTRPIVMDDGFNPGMTWISPDDLDPDFRAANEPFEAVIKRLGNDVLANFRFDKNALAAAGLRLDVPVSVYVANAKTSSALDAILKSASEQTPGKPQLAYTLGGRNALLITTRADVLANHTFTRQYAMAEFLIDPENDEHGRTLILLIKETVDPPSWEMSGSKCAISASKGVMTVTQTHENLKQVEQIMEDLNATYANDMLERRLHYHGRWVKKH